MQRLPGEEKMEVDVRAIGTSSPPSYPLDIVKLLLKEGGGRQRQGQGGRDHPPFMEARAS